MDFVFYIVLGAIILYLIFGTGNILNNTNVFNIDNSINNYIGNMSQFHINYRIPSGWKEINLHEQVLDTDINSDIILRAFEPTGGSLVLLTGYFIDDVYSPSDWLNAMVSAFSNDSNIRIIGKGIEKIGNNTVVNLVLSGKGNGHKFIVGGAVDTVRDTYLIPNGREIIQFILICPRTQYSSLRSSIRNVVGTLVFTRS
jgi:hypothetical protein